MNKFWPARSRTSAAKFVPKPVGIVVVSVMSAFGKRAVERQARHEDVTWSTTVVMAVM